MSTDSDQNPLDLHPVQFVEEKPGDSPGMVILVFSGATEGIWKHTWQHKTDTATAAAIKQYCQDCVTRGIPIYREIILERLGSPPN